MYKLPILFFSVFFCMNCQATTCPTLYEVKTGKFHGWQPLDIDNAEPIKGQRLIDFQTQVTHFAMAAWRPDAPEGSGECFYGDNQPDFDYLGVFLVKETGEPELIPGTWHQAGFDVMECNVSIENCRFKD